MIHISYSDFGRASRAANFALKRIIRIVPIYWVATFFAIAFTHHKSGTLAEVLCSLLFIPYSSGGELRPIVGQGWTLNYEMFFYTLFTLALFLPRRLGLFALFSAFVAIVGFGSLIKPLSDLTPPTTIATFYAAPLILLFALGMAIGVAERRGFSIGPMSRPMLWTGCAFAAAIAAIVGFNVPAFKSLPLQIVFWLPGLVAVVCCVYGRPLLASRFEGVVGKFGDASYSTYLFHNFVLNGLAHVFARLPHSPLVGVAYVLTALVAANVVGLAIHLALERPLTTGLNSWLSLLRAHPQTASMKLEHKA